MRTTQNTTVNVSNLNDRQDRSVNVVIGARPVVISLGSSLLGYLAGSKRLASHAQFMRGSARPFPGGQGQVAGNLAGGDLRGRGWQQPSACETAVRVERGCGCSERTASLIAAAA